MGNPPLKESEVRKVCICGGTAHFAWECESLITIYYRKFKAPLDPIDRSGE